MKVAKVDYQVINPPYESYQIITDNKFYDLRLVLIIRLEKINIYFKTKGDVYEERILSNLKKIDCNLFENINFPKENSWDIEYGDYNYNLDNLTLRLYFEIIKQKYNDSI